MNHSTNEKKCPACIRGCKAIETNLSEHGDLCRQHRDDLDFYFRQVTDKSVQEATTNSEKNSNGIVVPDTEEWEKEYETKFNPLTYTNSEGRQKIPPATFLFEAIKPFISKLLKEERERADYKARQDILKSYGGYAAQEAALKEGAQAERQRIEEEVEKLRRLDVPAEDNNIYWSSADEWKYERNRTLTEVLKIIKGEDIKR